ncbi:Tetratricopeptide domain protein [Nitrosococcus halophilus Nc 4]|uniref:Lipopolysaccharide assembly protein B n=1 Tax=Nitrosococcus halophilus (strain Nc4) TaxID=472759 RepID=D5BX36_NITHN|nr:lipopolysaccharide assembly protein LapB [Nitrosococcus halophilus]ADE15719.1 Tetratricopeptide domain protein [Nitrosococcus halophilus Nc 4]
MVEWLLLLLPVAAASGWLAGRRSAESAHGSSHSQLNSAYFAGLNYLLNEQPDKAIDTLLDVLEVDSDTVEPHLALGNLFRRRGEVGRAIRVHQNLIEKPCLSSLQREQALLELGLDYMRAGMLDRAESLFLEALKRKSHVGTALRQLLDIYQQEKNWSQAIAIAQQLHEESGEATGPMIAHFYCELAEQRWARKQIMEAAQFIKQALASDWRCVRATLLQAHLAMEQSDYKMAIRCLRRVEGQDPDYLPEILKPLSECYQGLDRQDEFFSWLAEALERHPGCTPLILAQAASLRRQGEPEKSRRFLLEQLRQYPSVEGLQQLLALGVPKDIEAASEPWSLIEEVTRHLLKAKSSYACCFCGFSGKYCYWQCPGCKRWGTVKPFAGNT